MVSFRFRQLVHEFIGRNYLAIRSRFIRSTKIDQTKINISDSYEFTLLVLLFIIKLKAYVAHTNL